MNHVYSIYLKTEIIVIYEWLWWTIVKTAKQWHRKQTEHPFFRCKCVSASCVMFSISHFVIVKSCIKFISRYIQSVKVYFIGTFTVYNKSCIAVVFEVRLANVISNVFINCKPILGIMYNRLVTYRNILQEIFLVVNE